MPGFYNNETRQYELQGWERDDCDWFEDEDGLLYLVPFPDSDADIVGPDNDLTDMMYRMLNKFPATRMADLHGQLHDVLTFFGQSVEGLESGRMRRFLNMKFIHSHLRRFSPEDGLYHA